MNKNLHYEYAGKLLDKARSHLKEKRNREALDTVTQAFSHLDILRKSSDEKRNVSVSSIEEMRRAISYVVHQIQPTYRHVNLRKRRRRRARGL